jgi:hypothetical protein
MSVVGRVALFVAGLFVLQATVRSAVRTVVVPQGEQMALTRYVFLFLRGIYRVLASRHSTNERRHEVLARYAPMATILLAVAWAVGVIVAFVPMYWSITDLTVADSFELSGSSFTTLGFVGAPNGASLALAVSEATLGLGVVALLIAYLPTIYGHFSRREELVVKYEVRAGSPPLPSVYLKRLHAIGWTDRLGSIWESWEHWFEQLEESHTSQPSLALFRSQRSTNSWITTAGAVLDTAAITEAGLDLPHEPQTAITLRAGFLSLQAIALFHRVPLDTDPAPNAPIAVQRSEFDAVLDELASVGIPVRSDREQAWRDFAGWRVNYDMALLALCELCQAPPAAWSSDRSAGRFDVPTLLHPFRWRVHEPEMAPSW